MKVEESKHRNMNASITLSNKRRISTLRCISNALALYFGPQCTSTCQRCKCVRQAGHSIRIPALNKATHSEVLRPQEKSRQSLFTQDRSNTLRKHHVQHSRPNRNAITNTVDMHTMCDGLGHISPRTRALGSATFL